MGLLQSEDPCYTETLWPALRGHKPLKWRNSSQSCPTLYDPMGCGLSGSSVPGILQARILEWVAIPFCRGSSWPRNRTSVSCIAGGFFTSWATREAKISEECSQFPTPSWGATIWFPRGSHLEAGDGSDLQSNQEGSTAPLSLRSCILCIDEAVERETRDNRAGSNTWQESLTWRRYSSL